MNQSLRPPTPARPKPPRISALGHKQWDAATFVAYILPRWATVGGGREPLPMRRKP